MARTNNLTNFLTDVASAIKTKTGDSTAIPASQFDTKIANITTGHLDNTEYAEANDDLDDILEGSNIINVYPPDWSEIGYENTPQDIIDKFNYSKEIADNWDDSEISSYQKFKGNLQLVYMPLVDTSNVINMIDMFRNCTNLATVSNLDTSSVTRMQDMFNRCTSLTKIPLLDTRNVTNMSAMFYDCTKLTTIPLLNTSNVTNMQYMFYNCLSLSNESLNNILAMCINAEKISSNKTLNYISLTSAQATICQGLSNYQAFLNAGWTTGY